MKPLDDFSFDRRRKDGRQARCRKCVGEYQKRYKQNNRERYLELRQAEYRRLQAKHAPDADRRRGVRQQRDTGRHEALTAQLAAMADQCTPHPGTPCILWQGTVSKRTGYGQVRAGADRGKSAHRAALEKKLGRSIRPGYQANHTCDVKLCINPDHLYEGTQPQNMADMIARGRSAGQQKTRCRRGHLFAGDNLYITPAGKRHCRACTRENAQRYRANKKEAA